MRYQKLRPSLAALNKAVGSPPTNRHHINIKFALLFSLGIGALVCSTFPMYAISNSTQGDDAGRRGLRSVLAIDDERELVVVDRRLPYEDVTKPPTSSLDETGRQQSEHHTLLMNASQTSKSAPRDLKTIVDHLNPWVVFYNIYIPPNATDSRLQGVWEILEDQIHQVGQSFAATGTAVRTIDMYFTTIGSSVLTKDVEYSNRFLRLCQENQLNCIHTKHFEKGYEVKSLTRVHQFCARAQHQHYTVIYLHNKGSFHTADNASYAGQNEWRRAMTAAATSDFCLNPIATAGTQEATREPKECNACGLLFQPLPYEHFPGNMWAARCDYIRKLHPPETLKQKRKELMDHLKVLSGAAKRQEDQLQQDSSILHTNLFPVANSMTGGNRYLSEFWLGSHPSLRPCDVSTTVSLRHWKEFSLSINDNNQRGSARNRVEQYGFRWAMAPRGPPHDEKWSYYEYMNEPFVEAFQNGVEKGRSFEGAMTNKDAPIDFFLLPGHLFRWLSMYSAIPSQSSWVWDWFPDGQKWKQKIANTSLKAETGDQSTSTTGVHKFLSLLSTPNSTPVA